MTFKAERSEVHALGTWRPFYTPGIAFVMMNCPSCGQPFLSPKTDIAQDGTGMKLDCACDFQDDVTLQGWPPKNGHARIDMNNKEQV